MAHRILLLTLLIRLAIQSLLLHKLRSTLTLLGVVFGVASVVAMLAIGEGASHELEEQLRKLGPDRVLLRSVHPPEAEQLNRKFTLEYGLTRADLQRIEELVPGVDSIAATYAVAKDVWVEHRNAELHFVGTSPDFREIHRLELARGRFLTAVDMERRAGVAVLGAAVARELFGAEEPIGREFKHSSGYYRIIGVLRPHENQSSTIHDPDHSSFIPLTTAKLRLDNILRIQQSGGRRYERIDYHEIALRATTFQQVPQIASIVRRLLEYHHPQRDYEMLVPYELLRQAERTKRVFSWVLGSIGGISLLVGGIGIMNVMLATVTERTKEIGVRRALGAKRWHIITQFLTESVVLSTGGGAIGLGLGVAIPMLVSRLSEIQTVITLWSLVVSLVISSAIGVLFGVYPARQAAHMDPIEALRHE